ncbi:MAG: transporter [Caulobacteraceae bacterium]|nr:transporter [Caulobacteraceae bacterium]
MTSGMMTAVVLAASLGLGFAASAQEVTATPADKSAYTLFNPTPDAQLRGFCTDRPTKSTGACTVDAGRFQVESDLFNFTVQRGDGVTTRTYLYTNPNLKIGVTDRLDLELNLAPVVTVSTHDENTRSHGSITGIGDLYLRAKLNLMGDDSGDVALALVPYVKAPTARTGIGDGAWEGGVVVPVSVNLPDQFSLGFDPEIDWLKNAQNNGRHVNVANLVTLSRPVGAGITASAELWADTNYEPTGQILQYSFDIGAAWIPTAHPTTQVDGGINFGLNRVTPGAQVYIGLSRRF